MSNSALITDGGPCAVYVHYTGELGQIEAVLGAYRRAGHPGFRSGDPTAMAHLAQVCCNLGDDAYGVGIDLASAYGRIVTDNGTYLVEGYAVSDRDYPYEDYVECVGDPMFCDEYEEYGPMAYLPGEGHTLLCARASGAAVAVPTGADLEALCAYCSERGMRPPGTDYGWARLCQVACNAYGEGVAFGPIEDLERAYGPCPHLDATDWAPGRGVEGARLVGIDGAQPPAQRLGEDYLLAPAVRAGDLRVGDRVYLPPLDSGIVRQRTATVEGFAEPGLVVRGYDVGGLPYAPTVGAMPRENPYNYLKKPTYRLVDAERTKDRRTPTRDER